MTGQLTAAAEVLAAHAPLEDGWNCSCGGVAGVRPQEHQADMLAAAGLLATPERVESIVRGVHRHHDAWLAEHDAQVAARAWDEGLRSGRAEAREAAYGQLRVPRNPYRADRIARGEGP